MFRVLNTAFLIALLLPLPAASWRRGSVDPKSPPPEAKGHHRSWSSTGTQGLDHSEIMQVKTITKPPTKTDEKDTEDHPDRAFLEHHPIASGAFTLDPHVPNRYRYIHPLN